MRTVYDYMGYGQTMPQPQRMQPKTFKTLFRGLVLGLVVVVGLVAYNIKIPTGRTTSKNWNFVLAHPTILLHIIMGSLMLLAAIVVLVWSARSHDRRWIAISALGLAFVIVAIATGEQYVATLSNTDLSDMGIGWFGAIATYGAGWYLSRKATQHT